MSNVTVNKGSMDTGAVDSRGFKHIGQSERIVSMIAGTTLASSAMRSRSLLSATMLLGVAAGMMYRGATGKCCFSKGLNSLNGMMNEGCNRIADRTGGSSSSQSNSKSNSSSNSNRSSSQGSRRRDEVTEASEESFPASDAPSFTPVTGESDKAPTHMNM
jgi:hypothetical protein